MGWVVTGLGKEVRIDERKKVIRVGRDERCNFAFPKEAEGVSRTHAILTMDDNMSLKLEDKSTYGTDFKGGCICKTTVTLNDGDTFSIQGHEFSVKDARTISSRNSKRGLNSAERANAKRSKISSEYTQKKVSDFFTRPSQRVFAEDTPAEFLRNSNKRKGEDHSVVMESIETIDSADIPSTSRIGKSTDNCGTPNRLFSGPEQSSASLFASRPTLAADTVNQSFNLNDVNSQMLFNPLANSTQNLDSRDVVLNSPESIPSMTITMSLARSHRDSAHDFVEPSPVPFPPVNMKARNKTSIFASVPTQNTVLLPSSNVLENNDNPVNPAPRVPSLNSMRAGMTGTMNSVPPRTHKKTSIFSNASNTTIRDVEPGMTNTGLTVFADVKPMDETSVNALRKSNPPYKNSSVPDVKRSTSSSERVNELRELASMICTRSVDAEDTPTVEEDDKDNPLTKLLKNMEKLVVFADLTKNYIDHSHISGLDCNSEASSTIGATKNFKKFRKAKQGKFNPALVKMSSSMNGTEDLVDFRKINR